MVKIAFVSSELLWNNENQYFPWTHMALKRLREVGYTPFIISQEPEMACDDRERWLNENNLAGYRLVLRRPGTDMITVPQWKAILVKECVSSQGKSRLENILFIDPDLESCQAVAKWSDPRIEVQTDLLGFYSENEI
jgi:hypothetical protein